MKSEIPVSTIDDTCHADKCYQAQKKHMSQRTHTYANSFAKGLFIILYKHPVTSHHILDGTEISKMFKSSRYALIWVLILDYANLSIFHSSYLYKLKGRYNNGDSIQSTLIYFCKLINKNIRSFTFKKLLNKSFKTLNGYTPFLMCDSLT